MAGRVEGKVCVVTGASQGIGLADAEALIQDGAKVVLTDIDSERGKKAAQALGANTLFIQHDVASEEDWLRVLNATVVHFGKIDVLVNNAGILKQGSIVDTSLDDLRRLNSVNYEGVFLGCKHVIPFIEKSGNGGSIINMSSIAAMNGLSSTVAYGASKGAVCSMTKSIAAYCREQNNGIRCNSVHPGGVRTQMVTGVTVDRDTNSKKDANEPPSTAEQSLMEPQDIAAAVLFLASDESRFMTGSELIIDNGYTSITIRPAERF